MKKASVYTRTGDKGTTGLVGGTRIKKSDPRIHLYGEVDELNSMVGVGLSYLADETKYSEHRKFLKKIQSRLFDLGSNLACEKEKREHFKLPKIVKDDVVELEQEIDLLDSKLPEIKHFILPGGGLAAANFHLARTVCRRVERQMVDFEGEHAGEIPDHALEYINRLSDYFFIISRSLNFSENITETFWIPSN